MGTWIDFSNTITIGRKTFSNGAIKEFGYHDITEEMLQMICDNQKIKYIQVHQILPIQAFKNIDRILKLRPDISFRVYGLYSQSYFDLDILYELPHLEGFVLDIHLANNPKIVDAEKLCKFTNIKKLSLNLFDLKDYSFIQGLSSDIEELLVMADTIKGTPVLTAAGC